MKPNALAELPQASFNPGDPEAADKWGGADTPSCSLWSASASLLTSTPDCSPAFDMGRGVSCLLKQDTYRELLGSSSGKLKGREESVCRTARS